MAVVLDGVLSERALLTVADGSAAQRGAELVDEVESLRVTSGRAEAVLTGGPAGTVVLTWGAKGIQGRCPCRTGQRPKARLCGHAVAVGLVALDRAREEIEPSDVESPVDRYLDRLSRDELRDLVVELCDLSDTAHRGLDVKAALAAGDVSQVSDELLVSVQRALDVNDFVSYYEASGVAQGVAEVLDELEMHLTDGSADAVRPALLKAMTGVRTLIEHADDSDGALGDTCQRAAELYARSCREGSPDPVSLARWLVRFRIDSPGWPDLELADFAAAFDDDAWEVYRAEVAALELQAAGKAGWKYHEVGPMLLELADHDGDVDRAVHLLQGDGGPAYGAIVRRLVAADRRADAARFVDRAVADAAVTTYPGTNDRLLAADWVARWYIDGGRPDDALSLLRALFAAQSGVTSYELLARFADELGCGVEERTAAWNVAQRAAKRDRDGSGLVGLALHDGDLDRAWAAADTFGAGRSWEQLAKASAATHPGRALDLYRARIPGLLSRADKGTYYMLSNTLQEMRRLAPAAGQQQAVNSQIREIREEYRRRPLMIGILNQAGLRG